MGSREELLEDRIEILQNTNTKLKEERNMYKLYYYILLFGIMTMTAVKCARG